MTYESKIWKAELTFTISVHAENPNHARMKMISLLGDRITRYGGKGRIYDPSIIAVVDHKSRIEIKELPSGEEGTKGPKVYSKEKS